MSSSTRSVGNASIKQFTTTHASTMDAPAAAAADPDTAANQFRPNHQFDLVDAETCTVMQNRANSSVRAKYESENVNFLV